MKLGGMYTDSVDKANNPEATWTENTRNIIVGKDGKAILNENGFAVYAYGYPETNVPVGHLELYDDEVVIFSSNADDTQSEIGIVRKSGNYEPVLRDPLLGFKRAYHVTGSKQINIYGDTEIVFTDNHIPLSLLNIDKLPFELDVNLALVDKKQINNLYVFPEMDLPTFTIANVNATGGNIPTGVVYFTGRYEDFNGAITNMFPVGNPTLILPRTETDYTKIGGGKPGIVTSNSVELAISGLDRRFKKLHLVAIRKNVGQVYPEQFATLEIKADTLNYTYTGTESGRKDIALGEVLVDRPSYKTAVGVVSDNDVLYPYGMSTAPRLNIQKYVNGWKIIPITDAVKLKQVEGSFKDGKTFAIKRPFMHNEVYAKYAVPVMLDGTYGDAFHIPGREARIINEAWNVNSKLENELNINLLTEAPFLAEDDIISPSKTRYYQTRDTATHSTNYRETQSPTDAMGYWENQYETYGDSDDWDIHTATGQVGTLRNQKVRHHKMPAMNQSQYVTADFSEAKILGIQIADVYLPAEIWQQIQGIEIFYAKRTGANATLAGRGLMIHASTGVVSTETATTDEDKDVYSSTTANLHYTNGGGPVPGGANTELRKNLRNDAIRIQAFDMLVDKTSVLPNFVYASVRLDRMMKIDQEQTEASSQIRFDMRDNATTINSVTDANKIRILEEQQYFPANTIISDTLTNRYCEETFFAKLKTPGFAGITPITYNDATALVGVEDQLHQVNLVDLKVWKESAYITTDNQDLVSTGHRINTNGNSTPIFGGDAYVGTHGFIATADNTNTLGDASEHDAIRAKFAYYVETANAPELQYDEFYPKVDIEIEDHTPNKTEYPIIYNKDYTSINNLNPVFPVKLDDRPVTLFQNRILRSKKSQREEKVSSWRIFLPNDYYETARDRGRIVHMEAMNGELLIQQEYGLFLTQGNDVLHTDAATVEVGSGDVFARDPREIVDTKDGYIGCQSKTACIKGKGFYFTVDQKQGKVFILDNSLKETSNEGMYNFFREWLRVNQLSTDTMIAAFDEVNNRILLTKKEDVTNTIPNYRGEYVNDVAFISSLQPGDVVKKDGQYVKIL